ncbi:MULTISPECIES: phosphate propanoyltransferase [unclassified Fusibacter]|uniref:phosphate propanoyltransferase n=1 Tax=unclassified Fusibacter TaxID=2624464 RepID=UPI001011C6DA|nr:MULTISPECIES: phosphate propanoyltransferase [unclassified Fusibacter]MCK8058255.1 phosphate propanoyltransferase [Fusibacter sp. A2]NPE20838.1 phosphate propanoyltransferase [Fusibacter sp. A1]RXV63043.1 phosphate propanoyltransferase [Fusibacter sp. A1]
MTKKLVPVGISNRHIHLSQADIDVLFGEGHELTNFKDLKQPGQYACEEKVDLVGPRGTIKGVRILGPARKQSQIEVSITDSFALGVKPPVRGSGDLAGSPGIKMVGPKGEVELSEGVIAAERHIHMHTSEAETFGLKDRDVVSVQVEGERSIVFNKVLVRVHPEFALEFHVDVDEANAAGLKNGVEVEII